MNKTSYKYIIGSGWWCDQQVREHVYGASTIRAKEFHNIWYRSVNLFTKPEKILIVDSHSPIKPELNTDDKKLEFISLNENGGHGKHHRGKFNGWTRSVLMGLEYADMCDADYFVYVEQDCLLYGKDIIENSIAQMSKPYMFGSAKGSGTWHPLQQSLFIIQKNKIAEFHANYKKIKYKDGLIEPEIKFCMATSKILMLLPHWIHVVRDRYNKNIFTKTKFLISYLLVKMFGNFDELPFGYGGYKRDEGLDFNQNNFYFQHGSEKEITEYIDKINNLEMQE